MRCSLLPTITSSLSPWLIPSLPTSPWCRKAQGSAVFLSPTHSLGDLTQHTYADNSQIFISSSDTDFFPHQTPDFRLQCECLLIMSTWMSNWHLKLKKPKRTTVLPRKIFFTRSYFRLRWDQVLSFSCSGQRSFLSSSLSVVPAASKLALLQNISRIQASHHLCYHLGPHHCRAPGGQDSNLPADLAPTPVSFQFILSIILSSLFSARLMLLLPTSDHDSAQTPSMASPSHPQSSQVLPVAWRPSTISFLLARPTPTLGFLALPGWGGMSPLSLCSRSPFGLALSFARCILG